MRKIALCLGISIDGYIARPDGSVDYLFIPPDFSMGPFLESTDAVVMGRKTLEAAKQMGASFDASETYVFSRSQPEGAREGVVFVNESPGQFVARLRERPGKDIWLYGGGELVRAFLAEDLVDSLYLGIVPVLLGEGIPLFPSGFPQRDFTLVENKSYSQGLVALKYERARKS